MLEKEDWPIGKVYYVWYHIILAITWTSADKANCDLDLHEQIENFKQIQRKKKFENDVYKMIVILFQSLMCWLTMAI